jgi:hypothetical protein
LGTSFLGAKIREVEEFRQPDLWGQGLVDFWNGVLSILRLVKVCSPSMN